MTDIRAGTEPADPPGTATKNDLQAAHSATSWRWQWFTRLGQHEVAYLPGREVWFTRYRAADPDGGLGGWNDPQQAGLPRPIDRSHAARIAQRYADSRRTARCTPSKRPPAR
ncbi:hypothetical protein [Actinomycetospora sp. TBRC 11914]|uniref:hypothetical protein n=1 Tax=Actinomycetospora sp. TBRC 11914 TaxID=2729387 RepID=UPI00145EEC49|nr:hypothetical protein [Actinomycetospora sp. TBRC 11914]NMO89517.1 hypothetical protein [Actinomycetospora sp. TBRC 11914]